MRSHQSQTLKQKRIPSIQAAIEAIEKSDSEELQSILGALEGKINKNDTNKLRKVIFSHFDSDIMDVFLKRLPKHTREWDIMSSTIFEHFEARRKKDAPLEPGALQYILEHQMNNPDERRPLQETVNMILGNPLKEHQPYRDVVQKIMPDVWSKTLNDPEKMLVILDKWGEAFDPEWGGHDPKKLHPSHLDRDFLKTSSFFVENAFFVALEKNPPAKRRAELNNPYFWEKIMSLSPEIKEGVDKAIKRAQEINALRHEIIFAQWPNGMTLTELKKYYDVPKDFVIITQQLFGKGKKIPAAFICHSGEKLKVKESAVWKEQNFKQPPPLMYQGLGEYFLKNLADLKRVTALLGRDEKTRDWLLSPQRGSLMFEKLTASDVKDSNFIQLIREGYLKNWRYAGLNAAQIYATIVSHKKQNKILDPPPKSITFAQTLQKYAPEWLDDGRILEQMKKNGMPEKDFVKITRARMVKTIMKDGGVSKLKSKMPKKERKM